MRDPLIQQVCRKIRDALGIESHQLEVPQLAKFEKGDCRQKTAWSPDTITGFSAPHKFLIKSLKCLVVKTFSDTGEYYGPHLDYEQFIPPEVFISDRHHHDFVTLTAL